MTSPERLSAIAEADWVGWVVSTAVMHGWVVVNTADSRRANAGWPVFVAVRDGRMVIAQLKGEAAKVTTAQQRWLDELDKVAVASDGALTVGLWRPSHRPDVDAMLA